MTDIFKIEQEFQTLKKILPLISSSRLKIEKTSAFIDLLLQQENQTFLKAYSEILPAFLTTIRNTQFIFTPINFIDKLESQISALHIFYFSANEENINAAKQHLAGQKNIILSQIAGADSEFSDVARRKQKIFSSSSFVNIPLVVSEKLLANIKSRFATVSKLFVEISFVDSSSGEDKIEFHQHFNDDLLKEIRAAVIAAKNSFEKLFKVQIRRQLKVKIRFENNSVVSGLSFLCGLTLQIIFELMKLFELRALFALNYNVAVSASVDGEGRLLPVSENTLKLKIEACFYSNINIIILSKENESAAKEWLNQIQTSAAIKKEFKIVAVESIHDLLVDRRLVQQTFVPASSYLINKIWKKRRPIAAALFLFLLIVIGKMLYGPIDKNPTDFEFAGNFLIIKNNNGQNLFYKDYGRSPEKIFSSTEKPVAFFDLDNDGLNEVYWIDKHTDGNPSVVYCQSYDGKNTLWKKEMTLKLNFPNDPVPVTALAASDVIVDELDGEPGAEAYIFSRLSGYYPSILTKVDARTGKTISYYVHDGNFGQFAILDLDGDGKKEFLITGMNNSLYSGVVMVLDPKKIRGYSPHDERHKLENSIDGEEKIYLTIPRTIVGKKLEHAGVLTSCNLESLDTVRQTIRISVEDLHLSHRYIQSPTYYIHFDFSLKPQSVSTSTGYEYWAEFLYKSGELDFLPNHEYLKSTLNGLKLW